jgi:hypothetical protein
MQKGIVNIYYLSRECRGFWPAFWQPAEIHASGEDSPEPLVRVLPFYVIKQLIPAKKKRMLI